MGDVFAADRVCGVVPGVASGSELRAFGVGGGLAGGRACGRGVVGRAGEGAAVLQSGVGRWVGCAVWWHRSVRVAAWLYSLGTALRAWAAADARSCR
ncbi:hypothetical protein GCM10010404_08600 [Nonomuraea africana]